MNWIKENSPWINVLLIIGAAVFLFFNCGLSRSPLIKDDNIPDVCKMDLDQAYFHQKMPGKSDTYAQACAGQLTTIFCDDKFKEPDSKKVPADKVVAALLKTIKALKHSNCMAKQGK